MKDIHGATAIVTGASRGIGPYIAKTLAREGAQLALAARDAAKLEETRVACEALGVRAIAVACDVNSTDDLRGLVGTTERALGPIDILVNNAGIEIPGMLMELTDAEADAILETNLRAPIRLTRLVLPGMLARKRGAIVHVSSMAGKSGAPYNVMYSATKFALQGLNESMQFELEGTGVHMGTVCPGFVADAGMWADRGEKAPRMVSAVPPQKVADGVLKVIRGSLEALVTPAPFRPLLALNTLFPGLQRPLVKRMGVAKAMRNAPRAGAAPAPEKADAG
jgi:short-subunit dehydrogenase